MIVCSKLLTYTFLWLTIRFIHVIVTLSQNKLCYRYAYLHSYLWKIINFRSILMNQSKLRIKDMTMIALFTAIIVICSWITIPTVVPFTLQLFAIFTTLGLLGGRRGTIAVILYLLLGIIGIPVFSGMRSGIGVLLSTTGGYLLGFLLSALVYWLITSLWKSSLPIMAIAMVLGLLLCYLFGTVWFRFLYTQSNGAITTLAVLQMCVFPFLIPDCIKIILSLIMIKILRKRLPQ